MSDEHGANPTTRPAAMSIAASILAARDGVALVSPSAGRSRVGSALSIGPSGKSRRCGRAISGQMQATAIEKAILVNISNCCRITAAKRG
jgi:hypothetical protein